MRTHYWTFGEVVPWGVNAPPNFNISILQNICKNLQNNMWIHAKIKFEGQKLCLGHCLHNGHLMYICEHPYAKLIFITCIGEGSLVFYMGKFKVVLKTCQLI
jgi:hypothetical protein